MIKRIHVNRHNIAANRKAENSELPPFTVKTYRANSRGHCVEIMHGGLIVARFVYQPDKPLSCGAVAWVETECEARVYTEEGIYAVLP